MLDFNDQDPAVPSPIGNAERDELRSALLARLDGVLFALFPAGKVTHGKFVVGDVLGSGCPALRGVDAAGQSHGARPPKECGWLGRSRRHC